MIVSTTLYTADDKREAVITVRAHDGAYFYEIARADNGPVPPPRAFADPVRCVVFAIAQTQRAFTRH